MDDKLGACVAWGALIALVVALFLTGPSEATPVPEQTCPEPYAISVGFDARTMKRCVRVHMTDGESHLFCERGA